MATQKEIQDQLDKIKAEIAAQNKDNALYTELLTESATEQAQGRHNRSIIAKELGEKKAAPYWKSLNEQAKKMVKPSEQNSYTEWSTVVMEIFIACDTFVHAGVYDNSGWRALGFVWNETARKGWNLTIGNTQIGKSIEANAQQFGSKVLQKVGLRETPVQPELIYSVEFDETGKLSTHVTKNGLPLTQEQQKTFDTGLIAWTTFHGCTFDPDTQVMTDDEGNLMTMEKLRALNDLSYETGLEAFFKGVHSLEITHAPRPGM